MTNQEAFDKMMEHLRSLKARSIDSEGACTYNGSKCAVGALMTDEEQEEFGSLLGGVYELLEEMDVAGHDSALHDIDFSLLACMQDLHDKEYNWSCEGFIAEDKSKRIAKKFNLTYTSP